MSIKRNFRFVIIAIGAFLLFYYYQAYTLYKHSENAQHSVSHTNVVIGRLEYVYANVWQLQGAHRMKIDPASRGQVEANIHRNMDSLLQLTRDNPLQQTRLERLHGIINKKLALLRQPGDATVPELLRLDDSLRNSIGILIGEENNLLHQRSRNFKYYSQRRYLFSVVTLSLLAVFLLLALTQVYRSFTKRIMAERLARNHEEKYGQLIERSQFTTAIIGLDKTIRFISANVEELTGLRKDDLIGSAAWIEIPTVAEWTAVPGRTFMDFELQLTPPAIDGKWIAYRLFPLYGDEGAIIEWQIVAWDINLEKRMEEEIGELAVQKEQQQKLMQNIIDNIPSAIYIKDLEGRYVIVNKKLCDMWNFTPEEVLGRRDVEVFPTVGTATYQLVDAKVLQYKSMVTQEDSVERNGRKEYFWIVKFPLMDEAGEVRNICGVATDITDRKENELKLIQATRVAESSRIAQEAFLANMSHEIRTPMNGIMGMSNLLLSTRQTTEQQEYAENILESARHLLAIINDILDFSKIKAGKFQFEHIPFKPRHAIKKALYPLQFKADEKMVKLSLDMDDSVPEVLTGDPLRLQQIIINLVGNALKFTQEGSVQIIARCKEERAPGACLLEVLVKDTGIGIPQNKLQLIFESFTQNNVNTSRKYGGTGLGLAIVKQLVELQKGRVWVESIPGKGSTFGFSIPYKTGELPVAGTTLQQSIGMEDTKMLAGIKVLVAEDNLINQKVVNITLSKQGAEVTVVNNGQQAIDAVQKDRYDVILMDLQMPEVDGYKATREIRNGLDGTIPIIAMTADALKGEAEKCFEAGMNGYISKPFEPRELYQEILRLARKRTPMQEQDNDPQPVDLTYLYELSGNDPAYINEVLDLFLGTMPEGLQQLEHLVRHTDDWDSIYRQAHFLKSSVSVIHVRHMFDNLSKIEAIAQQKEDKAGLVQALEETQAIYARAHPVLLAEKARHHSGTI